MSHRIIFLIVALVDLSLTPMFVPVILRAIAHQWRATPVVTVRRTML